MTAPRQSDSVPTIKLTSAPIPFIGSLDDTRRLTQACTAGSPPAKTLIATLPKNTTLSTAPSPPTPPSSAGAAPSGVSASTEMAQPTATSSAPQSRSRVTRRCGMPRNPR